MDAAASPAPTWEVTPAGPEDNLGPLVAQLTLHHHRTLRRALPYLDDLLSEVIDEHGDDLEITGISQRFDQLVDESFALMNYKERVVFPQVILMLGAVASPTAPGSSISRVVDEARDGHETVISLLEDLHHRMDAVNPRTAMSPVWTEFRSTFDEVTSATIHHLCTECCDLYPALLDLEASLDT